MPTLYRPTPHAALLGLCLRHTLSVTARRAVLVALVALVAIGSSTSQAQRSDKVATDVSEALRAGNPVRVVVALQSLAYSQSSLTNLEEVKYEVARLQQSVLSALPPSSYRSQLQFETVPALVVTLLSTSALEALRAHPSVRRVDLDVGGEGDLADSVALIHADQRQSNGNTGTGVIVAVLDSGIDTDHPDFAGRIVHQECFLDNGGTINGVGQCPNGSDRQTGAGAAEDDHGHGTHVSGIVASGGAVSSVGVAPNASLVAIKVLNSSNSFSFFSEIVAALDFVSANPQLGVSVINMSLGTSMLFSGDCDNATAFTMAGAAAVNTLRANGVTTFASSGNNGSDTQMVAPGCLSNVISVGASDNQDIVAPFSNSNASTDIFAPGVAIVSSARGGGTTPNSGTSMASPHAAGCAALLVQSGDAITPEAIEAFMEASPVQVTDSTNGLSFPRLDCSPVPPNAAPSADAGPDQTVIAGQSVTLDGSASADPDGDALTYAWTLAPTGTLSDATVAGPTFCAATAGAYTATLVVNDGTVDSAPDAAVITAITPTAAIDALAVDVAALHAAGVLSRALAGALTNNLTAARRHLARGHVDGALDVLAGFRRQALSLWQNDGVLTEGQAMALVASVDAITGALAAPCTTSATAGPVAAATTAGSTLTGLGAAYPNPSRGGVTVPYGLDTPSAVRLAVYDMLGREVAVLVDGAVEAGAHTAALDGARFPSGVYLLRMTIGDGMVYAARLTLAR